MTHAAPTSDDLEARLREALAPTHLTVTDTSHKHRGHAEAKRHGGSHFKAVIVSDVFSGRPALERHRQVYAALGGLFAPGGIHALELTLFTPTEWASRQEPRP